MFSLSFLFLTLPLYFSHVFMHFGVMMGDASFERQKMYLFLICIALVLVEIIVTRFEGLLEQLKKYGCLLIGLVLLPLVPIILYGGEIDTYWIRGSYEKFHGYLLYVGILLLGFSLSIVSLRERRGLINISLISASIVSVVAILEAFGFSIFLPTHSGAWGEGLRTIATMGNPNYLAGYLLLCLPLVSSVRSPEKWLLMLLVGGALFTTGSYIGIGFGVLYGGFVLVRYLLSYMRLSHTRGWIITWGSLSLLVLIGIVASMVFLPTDKLLSLTGRFVLMGELLREMIRFPLSLITGYGPEAVLRFFSESRTAIVDSYFPRESIIDSSHNILLDIIFQYGIVPVVFLSIYIYKNWNTWNPHARASWILGIAFLMFNPYVVMHLVLLTLTLHDDRK